MEQEHYICYQHSQKEFLLKDAISEIKLKFLQKEDFSIFGVSPYELEGILFSYFDITLEGDISGEGSEVFYYSEFIHENIVWNIENNPYLSSEITLKIIQ